MLSYNKITLTGDQLAIAKETGRRLGMGTNMYPSSSLLGENKDELGAVSIDELIEHADGFAGVFPGKSSIGHMEVIICMSCPISDKHVSLRAQV